MNDDDLLERLGAALMPAGAPAQPPPSGMQDLHRAIDAVGRPRVSRPTRPRTWRVLPIAVAGAVAACAAFLVVVTSRPNLGTETATRITVAVTSPAFGEVAARQRDLELALADGDRLAVAAEAARLRQAIISLTPAEWEPIRTEVEDLLARADVLLGRHRRDNGLAPSDSSEATSTTAASASVTTRPNAAGSSSTVASGQAVAPSDDDDVDSDDDSGPGGDAETEIEPDDDSSGPGGDSGEDGSGESGGGDESDDDDSGPGSDE